MNETPDEEEAKECFNCGNKPVLSPHCGYECRKCKIRNPLGYFTPADQWNGLMDLVTTKVLPQVKRANELRDSARGHAEFLLKENQYLRTLFARIVNPIPMILICPACSLQHIDKAEWATKRHRTHRCESCRHQWKVSNWPTVGVSRLGEEAVP